MSRRKERIQQLDRLANIAEELKPKLEAIFCCKLLSIDLYNIDNPILSFYLNNCVEVELTELIQLSELLDTKDITVKADYEDFVVNSGDTLVHKHITCRNLDLDWL